MIFYVGLHQPSDAKHFTHACISVNRLRGRRSPVVAGEVLLDSGAFTEVTTHGGYRSSVAEYAAEIVRLAPLVPIVAAVSQDYMCEPFVVARTGLSVPEHQRLTIERYDQLMSHALPVPVLPVLQGYAPQDYARHVRAYGDRLAEGQWVGVGSVCKRNSSSVDIANVLGAINHERPDLLLHGFGLKKTALMDPGVRAMLYSADSMAWSFSARKQGRDGNSWLEARAFEVSVQTAAARPAGHIQMALPL